MVSNKMFPDVTAMFLSTATSLEEDKMCVISVLEEIVWYVFHVNRDSHGWNARIDDEVCEKFQYNLDSYS